MNNLVVIEDGTREPNIFRVLLLLFAVLKIVYPVGALPNNPVLGGTY